MAVIFMDGFDWYLTPDLQLRWTSVGATCAINNSISRVPSAQSMTPGGNTVITGANIHKVFGATYTSGVLGFAVRMNATATKTIALVTDGTSEQISVRTNGSSVPIVSRNGTTLATGSTVLSANVWYYFELKFTINNSTGVIQLKLNGAAEIASTSSLDTQATGNTLWDGVGLGNLGTTTYFDDVYVLDTATGINTDFLGPVLVVARYPDGNGNSSSWTPNGGSNMGCVSEPYEDGNNSFVQSSTANQIDTYTMQNLPAAAGSVYALAQHTVAAQDGGAARSIAPVYRISGTDYVGTTVNTSASYQFLTEISDDSPATSSAWTVSEVNGLESGFKLIS